MKRGLHVYTCKDHDGVWPVGTAAVVVAKDEEQAKTLVMKAFSEIGISHDSKSPITVQKLDLSKEHALILRDGNY